MKTILEGLQPTPIDENDFSFGAVFGHTKPANLPDHYEVGSPLVIKDQGETDMCTAYAITAVSEDQEGVVLDPFFTFGETKKLTQQPDAWGADLRSACKSGIIGFRPVPPASLSLVTEAPTSDMRDDAAYGRTITVTDEAIAKQHAKKSFFSVTGPYDLFDNMRSAMWIARAEKRSIFTGADWRSSWTHLPKGIIEEARNEKSFGHAIKAYGWEDEHMLLQLSNGTEIGDGGIFRIAREALNTAFTFGAFTFMDIPREDAEAALERAKRGTMSTFFSSIFTCKNKPSRV